MAVRLVELNPTNATAWRNLGFLMRIGDAVEVLGEKCHRHCVLLTSCKFASSDIEIAASAYAMGADPGLLFYQGKEVSRNEILRQFLDRLGDDVSLRDAAEHMMGQVFVTQVLSELSLLFSDHRRVAQVEAEYHVTDRVIGSGAYGQVVEAYHVENGDDADDESKREQMAAKIVAYDPTITSINKNQEMMLMTCSRFQAYITRCHFIKFCPAQKTATMFLEYAPHGSLHHMITAQGHRFHEGELRKIFAQLLECLSHMHDYNVVHQDIKPQNILGFDDGIVKLADFGVSCNLCCGGGTITVGGTQSYMPPEALNLDVVSTAGDLWSLGVTMVELASGAQAIPDPAHVEDDDAEPPYRPYVPDHLSPSLKEILRRCLDSNHETRITAKQALAMPYFTEPLPQEISSTFETPDAFHTHKASPGIPDDVLTGSIYNQGLTGDENTMRRDIPSKD